MDTRVKPAQASLCPPYACYIFGGPPISWTSHERPSLRPPDAALQAHAAVPARQGPSALSQALGRRHSRRARVGRGGSRHPRDALRALAEAAFTDINHLLRPAHLASLKAIVEDPEASENDKFVAYDFLKNANIAAGGVLPMCQDTGTAIIMGKKGRLIWTQGDDEAALAEGARDAYLKRNLRYSQLAPISMFEEKNTRSKCRRRWKFTPRVRARPTPLTSFCSSPRAAARRTNRSVSGDAGNPVARAHARLPQGEGVDARHRGVPALPSSHRHRRHLRRADDEDGQARLLPILRRAP